MHPKQALIFLADVAVAAIRNDQEKLTTYQAIAAAFHGVCDQRFLAAKQVVDALLQAERAQGQFALLLSEMHAAEAEQKAVTR